MRILQDTDFAGQYLQVMEEEMADLVEMGEGGVEEVAEEKWMRRKKRIEMFQEEVWEAFLEGKVENPFKKKVCEKGDCEGPVSAKLPSNPPDQGVIEGSYPTVPFLAVRNDASGGEGVCAGRGAVSVDAAPALVSSVEPASCNDWSRFGTGADVPATQISAHPTLSIPSSNELPDTNISKTDHQPAQDSISDEPRNG